jgi:hypothetical protein
LREALIEIVEHRPLRRVAHRGLAALLAVRTLSFALASRDAVSSA